MPQVGIPSTARPSHVASQSRLPGWAGAPWRSIRAPRSVRPPKTGSSGSSALAPATISSSAPSPRSAVSSSATTRGAPRVVADELTALRGEGAELLIVAGASALDPLDPVFGGLTLLGARMERHGAPAHPGSLLWLATWEGRAVLGMPTCGMFSQATTFDLVLPQILAGQRVDNRTLAELGHGGLLSRDMAYRFPPYRTNAARGELE